MAVCCRIELFGGLRVIRGNDTTSRFVTQRSAELLAFLAYHRGQVHQREKLIEMLWPWAAPAAGRNCLSNELSLLRRILDQPGDRLGSVLLADRNTVQLDQDTTTTDVTEFDSALAEAERTPGPVRTRRLEEAIALYQGDLLAGLHEPWIAAVAEQRLEQFVGAVVALTEILIERGETEAAVSCLERAIPMAPLTWIFTEAHSANAPSPRAASLGAALPCICLFAPWNMLS